MEDFAKKLQDDLKSAVKSVKDSVNKEIHDYSGAEAWRDVKKTAVVTSTAVIVVLSCFIGE